MHIHARAHIQADKRTHIRTHAPAACYAVYPVKVAACDRPVLSLSHTHTPSPPHTYAHMHAGGVLCGALTHTHTCTQVACYAEHHVRVGKGSEEEAGGRVVTQFSHLQNFEDRVEEVADMMGEFAHCATCRSAYRCMLP